MSTALAREVAPGDRVFVALYDVHPLDEKQLDEVEGVTGGTYRKLHVRVATLEGDVTALRALTAAASPGS